ncbi:hypothetical protein [Burkholderia territorii]|uniref:hypothetical protein n=1 Tax=Burkholderia territorii TaxID=1503055 RepID=UPI0012D9CB30|nr:hypothetical protein [Burkholderia territorii]
MICLQTGWYQSNLLRASAASRVGDAVRVERGTLVGNPFAVYGFARGQKKIASGNTVF